jgi:hypothetical protein
MANPDEAQLVQASREKEIGKGPNLGDFINLLPELYYGVKRLLEECTGTRFSNKVAIVLWALANSPQRDTVGPYLTISDIVATFRKWFVAPDEGASSVVSKVKKDLFDLDLVKIQGGTDHLHLTEKGEQVVKEMDLRARMVLGPTVSALSPEEQLHLLNFARRMIDQKSKKLPGTDFLQLE